MSTRPQQLLRVSVSLAAAALAVNPTVRDEAESPPDRSRHADSLLAAIRASVQKIGPESTYTVVLKETVTGRDSKARTASTQTWAVRSDGSTLMKLGGSETGSRLIWFASGIEVMTNDRLRLKSTIRKPDSPPRRDPALGCTSPHITNEKSFGEETVEGYRAAKVTAGVTDRALTTWYSLDHGCVKIKSRMGFDNW